MLRSLLLALVVLALAPVALADGPQVSPGVMDGGDGLLTENGQVRFATVETGTQTVLAAVRTQGGQIFRWTTLRGNWGIPAVAFNGQTAGLSKDGRTLVVAQPGYGHCRGNVCTPLRTTSRFTVLRTKTLRPQATVTLKGDFSFDALSPSGRKLYLIQHVSAKNLNRYLVRAYDLATRKLAPAAIADRTQRGWVMQGLPRARATSSDGRFAYTLYQNPGGYPFVHALDTIRATARCIGLPWKGDQGNLAALKLGRNDRTLAITSPGNQTFFTLDTATYRVSQAGPAGGADFPWWTLGPAAAAMLLVVPLRRASRRHR